MKQKILRIAILLIGLILTADAVLLSFLGNIHFGIIVTFALGVGCILCGLFYRLILKYTQKGILKWIKYIILAGLSFALAVCLFLAVYGNLNNVNYSENAVIVLGAGIKGETVSNTLAYRLNRAVDYYEKNPDAIIVVSGGQGFQEKIAEAEAMKKYLIKKGVPQDKVVEESKASSTYENFLYSKKVLDTMMKEGYKVVFITNSFHVFRASVVAKSMGLNVTHMNAKTVWYDIVVNYVRELFAIGKYIVFKN